MGAIIDIRAADMKALREKNRALRRALADIEGIVRDNDTTVALLHELALLLIARRRDWRQRAEKLLCRGMQATTCQIMVFNKTHAALAKATKRLPIGGCSLEGMLLENGNLSTPAVKTKKSTVAKTAKTAKNNKTTKVKTPVYYHLPLRRANKMHGLLILTMRQSAMRDGDDTLCRRLSALLVAALEG